MSESDKESRPRAPQAAKDAIAEAFELLGGAEALRVWVEKSPENAKTFYGTIYPKLIPVELTGEKEKVEEPELVVRFV